MSKTYPDDECHVHGNGDDCHPALFPILDKYVCFDCIFEGMVEIVGMDYDYAEDPDEFWSTFRKGVESAIEEEKKND